MKERLLYKTSLIIAIEFPGLEKSVNKHMHFPDFARHVTLCNSEQGMQGNIHVHVLSNITKYNFTLKSVVTKLQAPPSIVARFTGSKHAAKRKRKSQEPQNSSSFWLLLGHGLSLREWDMKRWGGGGGGQWSMIDRSKYSWPWTKLDHKTRLSAGAHENSRRLGCFRSFLPPTPHSYASPGRTHFKF